VCKRFGRGSLGAILGLIAGELASPATEKKDGGEERSVAPPLQEDGALVIK